MSKTTVQKPVKPALARKSVSIPSPLFSAAVPRITRDFSGNVSRYVSELIKSDVAKKEAA